MQFASLWISLQQAVTKSASSRMRRNAACPSGSLSHLLGAEGRTANESTIPSTDERIGRYFLGLYRTQPFPFFGISNAGVSFILSRIQYMRTRFRALKDGRVPKPNVRPALCDTT